MNSRPDVVIIMTDEERAAPPYESDRLRQWRADALPGRRWFEDNGVTFGRHYTGSLACVPSRPTIFTGQYPDVHGVTQTDGLGKTAEDSRMRWLREGELPTLGHWFRAAGYDTHYDGKWHISHADLIDPESGERIATNDDDGAVIESGVQAYRDADPLDTFGFSGWIGPEPHGAALSDSGVRRDPLIASRVVAWLEDRYARRRSGDENAQRPFLLVASFVNPHDIALFPIWTRLRTNPLKSSPLEPPHVLPSPTDNEDLSSKPAAQAAFREAYPSGYGLRGAVTRIYASHAQAYRDLYHRLHLENDEQIDMVRRVVTDGGSTNAVLVRTSDHGDLLGAHGGLHQKWFNLYDEATRVPFSIARIGGQATSARRIADAPTSHVDILPTLLAVAEVDERAIGDVLRNEFTEVHPLPGRNLMAVVDAEQQPDLDRPVYLMTRDNILEGDTGASGIARKLRLTRRPPAPLRIKVPEGVATNFEGLVARVPSDVAEGGAGHLWKLVRTFDDTDTWTEPGVRQLASSGRGGDVFRTAPVDDEWELYDLTTDEIELVNRCGDSAAAEVLTHLRAALVTERGRAIPTRNVPWPYEHRHHGDSGARSHAPRMPARVLRKLLQRVGLHPADETAADFDLPGRRAVIVCTNHGTLDIGKPTGVFASEMTVPYYAFLDAGMTVDIASPLGGVVPVDPQSVKAVIRTSSDDRFLADDTFRQQVTHSLEIGELDMSEYDIVYLAGGWGAAFDLGVSAAVGEKISAANALDKVIGGVCHGPLGLLRATTTEGAPLVSGRSITAVTDKQIAELGIEDTPQHPERELRAAGADFESATRFRDPLANHWVVDGNLVTGQNQNAAPMVAREMMQQLVAAPSL